MRMIALHQEAAFLHNCPAAAFSDLRLGLVLVLAGIGATARMLSDEDCC
jgi:hypothetical protein